MKKAIALIGILAVAALARWGGGYGVPTAGHYWWWDNQANPWGNGLNGQPRGDIPPIYWGKVPLEFTDPNGLPPTSTFLIHTMPTGTQGFHKADEPHSYTLVDSFWYYNRWYKPGDKLYMSPDGWVSFEHSAVAPIPSAQFPFSDNIPALIGAYWADQEALGSEPVVPNQAQTVYFRWIPSTKQFVVEWYNTWLGGDNAKVYRYGLVLQFGGQYITWLKPGCGVMWSGHFIDFYYDYTSWGWTNPANWLVGIEDQTEAFGLTVDNQTTATHEIASGRRIRFGYGRVFRYNVEAYKILSPGKIVLRYTQIQPKVIVHNVGQEIVSYPLTFKIDSVGGGTIYGPITMSVFNSTIGKFDTIMFPCWNQPLEIGAHYLVSLDVNLDNDECPGDDTLKQDVWVGCDDTLSEWWPPSYVRTTAWTFGSDKPGFIDGVLYGGDPISGTGTILNGALLTGAVINIAQGIPDNNYGQWAINVASSVAPAGSPNGFPGAPVFTASGLRPAAFSSGIVSVPFTPHIFVTTAPTYSTQATFWLFYASDAVAGQWDEYPLVYGWPASSGTFPVWYCPAPGITFPTGPTVSGWQTAHYEPIYAPPNPYQPVLGLLPDLKAITHLVLSVRHLPPCYAKWERDLATIAIDEPHRSYMEVGVPITPKSTIANFGRNTEPDPPGAGKYFYTKCSVIDTITKATAFSESTALNKIGWFGNGADNPDTLHITYAPVWTPTDGGHLGFGVPFWWVFDVKLGIVGPDRSDHCPYNDVMKMDVMSLWSHDVGINIIPITVDPDSGTRAGILHPLTKDDVFAKKGQQLFIKARIRNYGFNGEDSIPVECTIKDQDRGDTIIYSHIYRINFLDWRGNLANNPDSIDIEFPAWDVPNYNYFSYKLEIRTLLPGDQAPANDFQTLEFVNRSVDEVTTLPKRFALSVIHPNPFFNSTSIGYDVPLTSPVSIKVYDATGTLVTTLVNARVNAGTQTVRWDGRDSAGRKVAQGVYVVRMVAQGYNASKKIVLLSH